MKCLLLSSVSLALATLTHAQQPTPWAFDIIFVSAADMPAVRAALPTQCPPGTKLTAKFDRVLAGSDTAPYLLIAHHPQPRYNGVYHIRSTTTTANSGKSSIAITAECP